MEIRRRAQAALFRRALSRTSRGTNCAQCASTQSAALLLRSLCAVRRTARRFSVVQSVRHAAHNPLPNRPLKSYNRMQMQLASIPVLSQPPLAAMPQLSEKPHQGFATKKTAWNPGPNVCNFTVTLGLQVVVSENGVRKTYSARYYNPATGRFLSRDPLDGKYWDPASLHKYLYSRGDPMNRIDPSGRADAAEYPLLLQVAVATTASLIVYKAAVVCLYGWDTTKFYSWSEVGLHGDTGSAYQVAPCLWIWRSVNKPWIGKWVDDYTNPPQTPPSPPNPLCEPQYENDLNTCRQVKKSSCYAVAMARYAACLAGTPLPPFNF